MRAKDRDVARRWCAVLVAAIAACALAAPAGVAAPATGGGLVRIGNLPQPPKDTVEGGRIVQVDPARQKLYYTYLNDIDGRSTWLVEYDLRTEIPTFVRSGRIGAPSELPEPTPYTSALDSKRNRLLFLRPNQAGENTIFVVDTKRFQTTAAWSLTQSIPGFLPMGMTYSAADDRVYLVGEMSQSIVVANGGTGAKILGPATAIVALDGAGGAVAWVTPLPECQQALYSLGLGALVARSRTRPDLHVACTTGGSGAGDTFPGQAGLIRVTVDPKATPQDALSFPRDFFPISGSYFAGNYRGLAVFDPGTDRFFMQSLARTTPGAWVFDSRMSAWVGFVTAPDAFNYYTGLNAGTGKFYMGSPDEGERDGYLVVADGRATPIPQGFEAKIGTNGFIASDPSSNRLFVPQLSKDQPGYYDIVILRDETPQAERLRPPDYDALTSDVEETDKTVSNFSGGTNGFGTRAVLVGGYRGALNVAGDLGSAANLRGGDRGLTGARVPSLDLRPIGASATAQALVEDSSTEAELKDGLGVEWPWTPASCLDGNGEPVEGAGEGPRGEATVVCDLAAPSVSARAAFDGLSGAGFEIGRSTFDAESHRDDKLGVVTKTVATASGIELAPPGAGRVTIAEVSATAQTSAHGRPGTAKAKWERTLSGVVVRDAEGEVTQRVAECTSTAKDDPCTSLQRQINDALGSRMRVDLFEPDVVRTPKGAFAGVQQTDSQFFNGRTVYGQGASFTSEGGSRAAPALQVTVFNDSVERSRLLVQLAAIQTNSIYTIAPEVTYDSTPPVPVTNDPAPRHGAAPPAAPLRTGTGSADVETTTGASDTVAAPPSDVAVPVAMPVDDVPGVLAFFARGPLEGVMVAAIWILFGCAGGAVLKRRALLEVVKGRS